MSDRVVRKVFGRTDFPQSGWIGKGSLTLWEGLLYNPIGSETQSFQMVRRKQDRTFLLQDQPVFDWFYVPVDSILSASWPAIETGSDFSYRMPVEKYRLPIGDWGGSVDWVSAILTTYDPATLYPGIHQLTNSPGAYAAIFKFSRPQFKGIDFAAALNLFEAYQFRGIDEQTKSYRLSAGLRAAYRDTTVIQNWLGTTLSLRFRQRTLSGIRSGNRGI